MDTKEMIILTSIIFYIDNEFPEIDAWSIMTDEKREDMAHLIEEKWIRTPMDDEDFNNEVVNLLKEYVDKIPQRS